MYSRMRTTGVNFLPDTRRLKRYSVFCPMITALSFFHLSGIAVTSNSFSILSPKTGCWEQVQIQISKSSPVKLNSLFIKKCFISGLVEQLFIFYQHYLVIIKCIDLPDEFIPVFKF